ncbi:hypothetical protein HK102_007963 [Quaeritorhiza haematococci]|nr:hypothetical protein HK102_007963 [Quaeritorhiza haematococci]
MFRSHVLMALALAAGAFEVAAASNVAQIHRFPPRISEDHQNTPVIDWSQFNILLSDAYGTSHKLELSDSSQLVLSSSGLFESKKAQFLFFNLGAPTDFLSSPAEFQLVSQEEITPNSVSEFTAKLAGDFASTYGSESKIASISSSGTIAAVPNAGIVTLAEQRPRVNLPSAWTEVDRQAFENTARLSYQADRNRLSELVGRQTSLREDKPVDRAFMIEMDFASRLFDAGKMAFLAKETTAPGLVAFTFSKLHALADTYGLESDQYSDALAISQDVFKKALDSINRLFGANAETILVTVPNEAVTSDLAVPKQKRSVLAECPATADACAHCSNEYTDDDGKPVPGFKGPVKWAGDMCQYQEISADFHILFWSSVGMIIVLVFVVGFLYNVEGNDDSSVGGGGHAKSD